MAPDTLTRWHRQLLSGRRRPTRRPGRPPLDPGIKALVLRLGRENPRRGYLRIRGELLRLGVDISATTIAAVLRRGRLGPAPRRIGPTWAQFLRLQAYAVLSGENHDLEDFPVGPEGQAPASIGKDGDGLGDDNDGSADNCPSSPHPRPLGAAGASSRSTVVTGSGVWGHARDAPLVAALCPAEPRRLHVARNLERTACRRGRPRWAQISESSKWRLSRQRRLVHGHGRDFGSDRICIPHTTPSTPIPGAAMCMPLVGKAWLP